jgi:hypothetical protein
MRAEPLDLESAAALVALLGGDRLCPLIQLFPKFRRQFALVPSQMTCTTSHGEELAALTTRVTAVVCTVFQFHEEVVHSQVVTR